MKINIYFVFIATCASHTVYAAQASTQKQPSVKIIDHGLDSILLKAAKRGDLQAITKLFSGNTIPDINAKNEAGMTAVMLAAHNKHPAPVNINIISRYGVTTHWPEVPKDHVAIVHQLIAADADLNMQNNKGMTALMLAVKSKRIDIAQELIAAGADPTIQNGQDHNARAYDYAVIHHVTDAYNKAVIAGITEWQKQQAEYRERKLKAQKIIQEQPQLIPDISSIITSYAYGPSPLDLPEIKQKEPSCIVQ